MIYPANYRSVSDADLRAFLDNVFQQVDTDRFLQIYRTAVQEKHTTEEIYATLHQQADAAKGNFFTKLYRGFGALKEERRTLKENLDKILDRNRPLDGYIEIGLPGRMIKTLPVTGPIRVINEEESLLQSGFPRPYDRFDPLTYDPIQAEKESASLISCFAGLHHCPPEKLSAFIWSIVDTLKPGGLFLLREHDAQSGRLHNLAAVVHSVFNAATGVSPQAEKSEVRNFRSLQYWITLLKPYGLHLASEPLKRAGDSSENYLLKFVKTNDPLTLEREKLISQKPNYTRKAMQTHLTSVEWFNVDSAQNAGRTENFWDYRYFRDCKELWKILIESNKQALKIESGYNILTSDYTLMNLVLTTLMTVEFVAKGILSLPLWALAQASEWIPGKVEDPLWQKPAQNYQTFLQGYGERLETIPFYAQSFLPHIQDYWTHLAQSWTEARQTRSILDLTFDRQTVKNLVTGIAMTVDLLFRSLVATPINAFFGGEENGDDRTIGLITHSEKGYQSHIVPRYKGLETFLKNLPSGTRVIEIAGQTKAQIDLVFERTASSQPLNVLYEKDYLPDDSKKVLATQVSVERLPFLLRRSNFHRLYDF
jgi:hypothetical protein